MEIKLNLEQLAYLKSLDSKKKKRKFLLDCLIENVEYELEVKEIIAKSNEVAKLPTDFCVQITDENRQILQEIWREKNGHNNMLSGNFLFSNSLFTYCYSHLEAVSPKSTLSTGEFLKYIGKEDLIERNVIQKCEICQIYPRIEDSNKCESCSSAIKFIVENDPLFENYRTKPNYSTEEIELVKHNINQREVTEQGSELLKFDMLKNDKIKEYTEADMYRIYVFCTTLYDRSKDYFDKCLIEIKSNQSAK